MDELVSLSVVYIKDKLSHTVSWVLHNPISFLCLVKVQHLIPSNTSEEQTTCFPSHFNDHHSVRAEQSCVCDVCHRVRLMRMYSALNEPRSRCTAALSNDGEIILPNDVTTLRMYFISYSTSCTIRLCSHSFYNLLDIYVLQPQNKQNKENSVHLWS